MEPLLSILKKTTDYFRKHGVENPKLDAELLIAHVLKFNRMQLYLSYERPMEMQVLDELRPLMKRRANREPIQYIFGKESFVDFELKVDSRALIPRPETEELIELIVGAERTNKDLHILDLGTGTGAIACALARHYPAAKVMATDVATDTLALAKENVELLELGNQITLLQSDWFESIEHTFDIIVSNPPYLSDAELNEIEPEVAKHEPRRALSSGASGLECIEILLSNAAKFLNPEGVMYLEVGADQRSSIIRLADSTQGISCEFFQDLNQKDRFVKIIRIVSLENQ